MALVAVHWVTSEPTHYLAAPAAVTAVVAYVMAAVARPQTPGNATEVRRRAELGRDFSSRARPAGGTRPLRQGVNMADHVFESPRWPAGTLDVDRHAWDAAFPALLLLVCRR